MRRVLLLTLVLSLFILVACESPNESPVVTGPTASTTDPYTGQTITITASATDADGDALTVSWEASAGSFDGATDADTVSWIAPATASVATITVTYSDGTDDASASVDITVGDLPELAYVGSQTCGDCHSTLYSDFVESGHPYKFNIVEGAAPTYPSFVNNFMELPATVDSWNDVAGVIGGFGWKARFVGTDGYIIGTAHSAISEGTGQNQHNFWGGYDWGWVDYDVSATKPYNYGCFKCHTTGGVDTANPDSSWLNVHLDITDADPMGYFAFGGVQCEACHGQGSQHAAYGNTDYIDRVTTSRLEGDQDINHLCGDCHTRNADRSVAVSSGKVKHHEQYDEFSKTAHALDNNMSCVSCHDPHKRTIWDGESISTACTDCHATVTVNHANQECTSCHMPYTAKSAVSRGTYVGDVHSHSFSISTDTTWSFINDDGATLRTDDNGKVHLDLEHVCYGCHVDENGVGGHETSPGNLVTYSAKTMDELLTKAAQIHQ